MWKSLDFMLEVRNLYFVDFVDLFLQMWSNNTIAVVENFFCLVLGCLEPKEFLAVQRANY